jgi:hypothetical protein
VQGGANAHWVCAVGGAIWALDWHQASDGSQGAADDDDGDDGDAADDLPPPSIVALSAHPSDDASHRLNHPTSGANVIQLWQMPSSNRAPSAASPMASSPDTPRLMFVIAHNGGVAWDLKWLPFSDQPSAARADETATRETAAGRPRLGCVCGYQPSPAGYTSWAHPVGVPSVCAARRSGCWPPR